jgi:hypothetical protein
MKFPTNASHFIPLRSKYFPNHHIFKHMQCVLFLCCKIQSFTHTKLQAIWTYGTQLWGTASTSNIEILERFQSKVLRMIVDAPRYVPNSLIRRDLSCPTVKDDIRRYSSNYSDRLRTHPNHLAVNLLRLPDTRRLRRFLSNDLPDKY